MSTPQYPDALGYHRLPVEPDEGLPQVFSCRIGGTSYEFGLYAAIDTGFDDPLDTLYDLGPGPGARPPATPPGYLVLRVVRQGPGGPQTVLLRKLVAEPDLVHFADRLAVRLLEARVARGNLNGRGHYGSSIVIGVAQRWV
ncbi:hypothetical protein [Streptomyces sp. NPDC053427]|uniref:hypothetical protein n=1 Tax=Streptomyces sp. NPDC053427 TaxID=3365701 RepID=UPI0037CE1E2B